MADSDYRRLGCAMEACDGSHKAQGYCLRHYRQWQRGGVKQDADQCAHCGETMIGKIAGSMYCGKRCKMAAWVKANPDRPSLVRQRERERPQDLCAYWAGYCQSCAAPLGGRKAKRWCSHCGRAKELEAGRLAALAMNEARHKAAGLVVRCNGCALEFCPLYGTKVRTTCQCCEPAMRREYVKAAKDRRSKRIKSADRETVVPRKVFARDGWLCRLCGIETPKDLRGTYAHNAPELDHITPLARGGAHTYANTQCLCRSCNAWKAARTMDEVLQALAA